MEKISRLQEADWVDCSYAPVYERSLATGGVSRLVATVSPDHKNAFERLALSLPEPYFLLYVLHTPRGEGDLGRYQSQKITREQLQQFLGRYGHYLWADARFDLWVHSPSTGSTVVWDRHNLLYAYGELAQFESELGSLGYGIGKPQIPGPHQHHYREEFDTSAREVLNAYSWSYTPLHPEDDQ